ncbi:hypothetical protein ACFQ1I_02780 [Kitasatospora arboriphila]
MPHHAEQLLADVDPLPYPDRQRLVARRARELAADGQLPALLSELEHSGVYGRGSPRSPRRPSRATEYLTERLTDPDPVVRGYALRAARTQDVPDEAIEAAFTGASCTLRQQLARVVRHGRRHRLAERLVGRLRAEWGDAEAAGCSPPAAPSSSPGPCPTSRTPSRSHPSPRASRTRSWTTWSGSSPSTPGRCGSGSRPNSPTSSPPPCGPAPNGPSTCWSGSARTSRCATTSCHRWPPPTPNAPSGSSPTRGAARPGPTACRPRAAPCAGWCAPTRPRSPPSAATGWPCPAASPPCCAPSRRAARRVPRRRVRRRRPAGGRTPLLLPLFPHTRRHAEARRQVAALRAQGRPWAGIASFLAHLPTGEAQPELRAALSRPDADDRAAAWTALLANAAAADDRDAVQDALGLLPRLRNEQDPVRSAALTALAQVPARRRPRSPRPSCCGSTHTARCRRPGHSTR